MISLARESSHSAGNRPADRRASRRASKTQMPIWDRKSGQRSARVQLVSEPARQRLPVFTANPFLKGFMESSENAFSDFRLFNHHCTIIHRGPTVGLLGVVAYILDGQCPMSRDSGRDERIGFKFGGTGVRSKSFQYLRRWHIALSTATAPVFRRPAAIWHSVCFSCAVIRDKRNRRLGKRAGNKMS